MCKRKHKSEKEAKKFSKWRYRKFGDVQSWYRCSKCEQWHLTKSYIDHTDTIKLQCTAQALFSKAEVVKWISPKVSIREATINNQKYVFKFNSTKARVTNLFKLGDETNMKNMSYANALIRRFAEENFHQASGVATIQRPEGTVTLKRTRKGGYNLMLSDGEKTAVAYTHPTRALKTKRVALDIDKCFDALNGKEVSNVRVV